jgi:hypothetical protein
MVCTGACNGSGLVDIRTFPTGAVAPDAQLVASAAMTSDPMTRSAGDIGPSQVRTERSVRVRTAARPLATDDRDAQITHGVAHMSVN